LQGSGARRHQCRGDVGRRYVHAEQEASDRDSRPQLPPEQQQGGLGNSCCRPHGVDFCTQGEAGNREFRRQIVGQGDRAYCEEVPPGMSFDAVKELCLHCRLGKRLTVVGVSVGGTGRAQDRENVSIK